MQPVAALNVYKRVAVVRRETDSLTYEDADGTLKTVTDLGQAASTAVRSCCCCCCCCCCWLQPSEEGQTMMQFCSFIYFLSHDFFVSIFYFALTQHCLPAHLVHNQSYFFYTY